MRWQFWQNAQPRKLSEQVQRALAEKFHVEPQAMGGMLCLSKRGQYSNRKVDLIRIFDPALVQDGHAVPLSYHSLLEIDSHHKALLFEGRIEKDDFGGRIEKNNQVFLTDVRSR